MEAPVMNPSAAPSAALAPPVSSSRDHAVPRRAAAVLALVCAGQFMVMLDVAIVNVALPSIQRGLGASARGLQWIVIAYGLCFGGFLLLGGRAADLLGRRRVFVAGLLAFAAASAVAGSAASIEALIAARAAQGVAGAFTAAAALSILTATHPAGPVRNRALGIWGAVTASGASAGVILGGLLTSGPGWRWIFFLNLPVALAISLLSVRLVPALRATADRRRFDVAGAITITGGLLLLVYAVNQTLDHGWTSTRTLALFAGAAALFAAFALIERRSAAPLVPAAIFSRRAFALANVLAIVTFGAFVPLIFVASLYLQEIHGYSPLRTGVTYLPQTLLALIAAGVAGTQLVGRIGVKPLVVSGLALVAAGLWLLARVDAGDGYAAVLPGYLLSGIGIGFSIVSVQVAAFGDIRDDEAGLASGLISTSQEIGGALGVATVVTLTAARTRALVAAGAGPADAMTAGFQRGFLAAAVIAATGALFALAFVRRDTRIGTPGAGRTD
jgi:EmrB/QacA subfamily drug resistance transporter